MFPGAPASLDALCKRFKISLEQRKMHGALLDAQLLARVYMELSKGSQSNFGFDQDKVQCEDQARHYHQRKFANTEEERNNHKEFIKNIEGSVWQKYNSVSESES